MKTPSGSPEVDATIDSLAFEARGHSGGEQPAIVLNQMMQITHTAGNIGIPGLYVTEDPGAVDDAAKHGSRSSAHRGYRQRAGHLA